MMTLSFDDESMLMALYLPLTRIVALRHFVIRIEWCRSTSTSTGLAGESKFSVRVSEYPKTRMTIAWVQPAALQHHLGGFFVRMLGLGFVCGGDRLGRCPAVAPLRHRRRPPQRRILVRHLRLVHLLEPGRDGLAPVELVEDGAHVAVGRLRFRRERRRWRAAGGEEVRGQRGRRRRAARGRGVAVRRGLHLADCFRDGDALGVPLRCRRCSTA